jgi:hypothetical protein
MDDIASPGRITKSNVGGRRWSRPPEDAISSLTPAHPDSGSRGTDHRNYIENPFGAASAHRGACPSIMLLALLSLCCGMILDTVSRGRKQMKRIDYLADQPPTGTHSSGVSRIGPDDRCSLRASPAPPTSTRCVRRYPKPMTASRSPVLRRDPRNGGGGPRRHHRGSGRQKGGARR